MIKDKGKSSTSPVLTPHPLLCDPAIDFCNRLFLPFAIILSPFAFRTAARTHGTLILRVASPSNIVSEQQNRPDKSISLVFLEYGLADFAVRDLKFEILNLK